MAIHKKVSVSARFTDAGVLDSHIATWVWGDGTKSPGTVNEAGGSGEVSGAHRYKLPGTYVLRLTVVDDDGGRTAVEYRSIVVYDPAAAP